MKINLIHELVFPCIENLMILEGLRTGNLATLRAYKKLGVEVCKETRLLATRINDLDIAIKSMEYAIKTNEE